MSEQEKEIERLRQELAEATKWAIFGFENFEMDWQWLQLHQIGKDYAAWLAKQGVVIDKHGRRKDEGGT